MMRRLRYALWRLQKETCIVCKKKTPFKVSTVEHIVPRSQNGTSDVFNLCMTCKQCNHCRGSAQTPELPLLSLLYKRTFAQQQKELTDALQRYGCELKWQRPDAKRAPFNGGTSQPGPDAIDGKDFSEIRKLKDECEQLKGKLGDAHAKNRTLRRRARRLRSKIQRDKKLGSDGLDERYL